MNFFSHHIRSLLHQDHRNPRTQFTGHSDYGDSGSDVSRMRAANRAVKFPKLAILSNRRPGSLDELCSKPAISGMRNRSAIASIARRVFRRHQAQEACQLADVFKLAPIPDSGQKLAGDNPADPGNAPQVLYTLRQFRIVLTEAADLFSRLLCGCQAHYTQDLFFSFFSMTFLLPDQRETACYSWHGARPSHLLAMRPSLRRKAPGSLSQGSNLQEFFSPASGSRRVVPWGDVSSWVKGAE